MSLFGVRRGGEKANAPAPGRGPGASDGAWEAQTTELRGQADATTGLGPSYSASMCTDADVHGRDFVCSRTARPSLSPNLSAGPRRCTRIVQGPCETRCDLAPFLCRARFLDKNRVKIVNEICFLNFSSRSTNESSAIRIDVKGFSSFLVLNRESFIRIRINNWLRETNDWFDICRGTHDVTTRVYL